MSKKALELLQALFAETSNIQLPIGVAEQILEVRKFVEEELKKLNA